MARDRVSGGVSGGKVNLIWLAAIPIGIYLLSILGKSPTERKVLRYKDLLIDAGMRYGVPPEILAAIFHIEANGNPMHISFIDGEMACGPIPIRANWETCGDLLSRQGFYLGAMKLKIYLETYGMREGLRRYCMNELGVGVKYATCDQFVEMVSKLAMRYAQLL